MQGEPAFGLGRQLALRCAIGRRVLLHEELRQDHHISGPFTQGGQAQVHDVQSIEQVFAKCAVLHRLDQVTVRGRQDADIDANRFGAAHSVDLALLNGAEQFGLQTSIHFGNFVEEQGSAIGLFELADPSGNRAGEGPFFMAE